MSRRPLSEFEDDDLDPIPAQPRKKAAQPSPAPSTNAPKAASKATPRPTRRKRSTKPTTPPQSTSSPATKAPKRPSNMHLDTDLVAPLQAMRAENKTLDIGIIIVMALEDAYADNALDAWFDHPVQAGGGLFAARTSIASRIRDEGRDVTPMNYRMTDSDYQVLDQLKDQYGAPSRSALISVALRHYFTTQGLLTPQDQ